ncbi:peptide ABC transporter permease [Planomicrobium okeanokoites]|uniref:Peptide ABC transporter permease n=1 Tax=Planomicrobium okeanokoites TaxID=244 RepID=A0ABV7KQ08_PLAOK|nr:peptide ABC transporter permease [Planomicrobium okeanokoites]TAA71110.1 peptide ABC transporter permease [Planomicrobium okeanokoites]
MSLVKRLSQKKIFVAGFTFISLLFLTSMGYYLFFDDYIPKVPLQYENGRPLHAPYSGADFPPLGSDTFGRNAAFVLLVGAKYTILAGLAIAFFRVVPAVVIGIALHYCPPFLQRVVKNIADAVNYFPITLFAFLLLLWIEPSSLFNPTTGTFETEERIGIWSALFVYISVLSFIFVPANSVLIANEIKAVYRKEFIASSITLGAGKWRILTKHIKPYLVPQVFLISMREFIQTLILMAHLGVFLIFIGGSVSMKDIFDVSRTISISSEWGGTLGMWWSYLYTSYPWLAAYPLILLTLLIVAVKCMMLSIEQVLAEENQVVLEKETNLHEMNLADSRPAFQLLYPTKIKEIKNDS